VILALSLPGRSAARIRTWTIGTKIRGAAFTLRRKSGPQPAGTWCHGRCAHLSATLPVLLGGIAGSASGHHRRRADNLRFSYLCRAGHRSFVAGASMTVLRRGGYPRLST
jgi:hypothetical protein